MTVNASGKLNADRIVAGKLEARHVTASVELNSGKLRLSELQADVLRGRHNGEWKADFTVKPPEYSGSGTFQRVALGQLADVMNGDWITGSATGSYHASTSGLIARELFAFATANLQVNVFAGVLPHVVLPRGGAPLQMRHMVAHLLLHDQKVDIQTAQIEAGADIFHLSGTASLTQNLDLKLTREDGSGFSITGTLTQPRISPVASSETTAALKP